MAYHVSVSILGFGLAKLFPSTAQIGRNCILGISFRMRHSQHRCRVHMGVAAKKREARDEHIARLKRTICRVPESALTPLVKSMKRRCVELKAVGGKHLEELDSAMPSHSAYQCALLAPGNARPRVLGERPVAWESLWASAQPTAGDSYVT